MSLLDTAQLKGTPTITEALQGRTVDYVLETNDGGIMIVCTDGREVKLGIAQNNNTKRWKIMMSNISTRIALQSQKINMFAGKPGAK